MNCVAFGVLAISLFHVINSNTVFGINNNDHEAIIKFQEFQAHLILKKVPRCDISSKYIDIAQINRSDLYNISVDELINKLHGTVDGNYKTINKILCQSECNFPYIERGLKTLQQSIYDIIDIFSCPEERNDADLLDAAIDIFVSAKDSMIADMRDASKNLTQECADLFTKIRPAACNTGENVCFTVLNAIC